MSFVAPVQQKRNRTYRRDAEPETFEAKPDNQSLRLMACQLAWSLGEWAGLFETTP